MATLHHIGGNGMDRIPQRTTRTECGALPKGWIREEVPRKNDNMNNSSSSNSYQINSNFGPRSDIYYISPMGKRIRSRPELMKYLGDTIDLTNFEYRSGKILTSINRRIQSSSGHNRPSSSSIGGKSTNGRPQGSSSSAHGGGSNRAGTDSNSYDLARGLRADASLVPPIRQTASIFKQPVTVHKISNENGNSGGKMKVDGKQTAAEKPRQLFWEKRLSGLRASYPDEEYQPFLLPGHFKPMGPGVKNDVLLASISTNIHMNNGPIHGQSGGKGKLSEITDPSVYINPDQPLISKTVVSQDDVDKQEDKVKSTRARLAKALEALSG